MDAVVLLYVFLTMFGVILGLGCFFFSLNFLSRRRSNRVKNVIGTKNEKTGEKSIGSGYRVDRKAMEDVEDSQIKDLKE